LGLATILFFTIAIFIQPAGQEVVPRAANIFSGLGVLAYSAFLIQAGRMPVVDASNEILNPSALPERPRFWLLAILEWAIFITTMLWFLGVSLALSA